MSKTVYPIIERLADEVIVTARSTVEAQQAAGDAMGGDCTIVTVERVREGGIGGFFSTELVRVTARPSRFQRAHRELDAAMTSAEELVSSLRVASPQFADRLMSELRQPRVSHHEVVIAPDAVPTAAIRTAAIPTATIPTATSPTAAISTAAISTEAIVIAVRPSEQDTGPAPAVVRPTCANDDLYSAANASLDAGFTGEELREALAAAVAATAAEPILFPGGPPSVAAPMPTGHRCTPIASDEMDRFPMIASRRNVPASDPRWSHQTLRAIGLPDRIVDIAMLQHPAEGPQWIMALMAAFRTLCAPAPTGPTVLIGPSCANLARQLRLVSVGADELSDSFSSVAIPNVSTQIARSALNDRYVHLMVGGAWQHLASIRPDSVSAATDDDLLETVRLCCAWDATLGWTLVGDRYERIDEFTLVAHVRGILYGNDRPAAMASHS